MTIAVTQKVDILNNIPRTNYLGLFEGNTARNVVGFLELTQNDVSKAMGIPKKSIRYDKHIPKELARRLKEIAVICELIAGYFNGDAEKTALWFQMKNPALGGISPRDMIRFGRYQKLEKFVRNALAGIAA